MATVTTFVDRESEEKLPVNNAVIINKNRLDFSATNVSSGDVVQAIKVPKGASVMDFRTRTVTPEGSAATATAGDGDSAAAWDASVNLNSAGFYATTKGTDTYADGRVYAANDTIDLVVDADLDTAVIDVWALYALDEDVAFA